MKLLPYILFQKYIYIFGHWKWPAQGTGTVPVLLCRHDFVPYTFRLIPIARRQPRQGMEMKFEIDWNGSGNYPMGIGRNDNVSTQQYWHSAGPDLQNILRQSYDYLTIVPKLRSTYDRLLIHKTSYERRKAFLRYNSLTKS